MGHRTLCSGLFALAWLSGLQLCHDPFFPHCLAFGLGFAFLSFPNRIPELCICLATRRSEAQLCFPPSVRCFLPRPSSVATVRLALVSASPDHQWVIPTDRMSLIAWPSSLVQYTGLACLFLLCPEAPGPACPL